MSWVRVDDKLPKGPKVKRAAKRLGGRLPRRRVLAVWLMGMCYCNEHHTDGFIPDYEVSDIEDENPRAVFEAMAHGDDDLGAIVERNEAREGGGWQYRNYDEYQPTKAEVEKKRKQDRQRQKRRRASVKRPRGVTQVSQRDTLVTTPGVTSVSATPGPALPGPSQPLLENPQRPRALGAPRNRQLHMELRDIAEVTSHLQSACHRLVETDPDCGDAAPFQLSTLEERLSEIAAHDLHVADYGGDKIRKIVDSVLSIRARRLA